MKKILYNEKYYSIQELEELLEFQYLPSITFESTTERKDVRKRGIKKWKNNEINLKAQKLGKQFIKKITSDYIPPVSIRKINDIAGHGLFAEEDLKIDCYVGTYTGIVRENNRRYLEPLNNYCYEYPVPDDIGRSFVIDARQGNLTRFINHSFTPNLKPVFVFYNYFYHVIFLAIRNIDKGEQLFYNYGTNYWYLRGNPLDLSDDLKPKAVRS